MNRFVDTILRWIVGATFLFSGFVKAVDPVGTTIYVEKYLSTYSLDVLMPCATYFAVALSVVELVLGAALVVNLFRRYALLAVVAILALFSVVTLLGATVLPIGDCGCFGEALKLSPWATFIKNIFLLLIALYLLHSRLSADRIRKSSVVVVCVVLCVAFGINLYALRHLPLIDFLPYKEGTNLRALVAAERSKQEDATQLIFRNTATGELEYFAMDDVECWLNEDLEYLDAQSAMASEEGMLYADFAIYHSCGEELSESLLAEPGRVAWLCVRSEEAAERHIAGIERLLAVYLANAVVVLTADDTLEVEPLSPLRCYSVDAMTLRSIMRAEVGVVVLNDGVVEFKSNIDDI